MVEGWPDWLNTWNNLGSIYPYFIEGDKKRVFLNIGDAIANIDEKNRYLDVIAIVEMVASSYVYDDRTMVRGIFRFPWLCKPGDCIQPMYKELKDHGYRRLCEKEIAVELKKLLCKEAKVYASNRNSIGIMLSGGLDSRIIAGIFKELQLNGHIKAELVALTWGIENSRDVSNAKKIAKIYDWEIIHYPLNPDILLENIYISGLNGALVSPLHLHAIPMISREKSIEIVIAGSYGDSVGRAEFSGVRLLNLKPTVPIFLDKFSTLRRDIVRNCRKTVREDAYQYRKFVKRDKKFQYREIEQQANYMRNKWQTCMAILATTKPIYQMFTSPDVYGLMWSLDPKIRNDNIYKELLMHLPGRIYDIPWARTGKTLNGRIIQGDTLSRQYHCYGQWLRHELYEEIRKLVLNDTIINTKIFNEISLEILLSLMKRANTVTTNRIDEIVTWLASLSVFIDKYSLRNEMQCEYDILDVVRALMNNVIARGYIFARNRIRD